MTVAYVGTYEGAYPRNTTFIRGLRAAGVDVIELHEPIPTGFKNSLARPAALMTHAARIAAAYLRLALGIIMMPKVDAVIIGYPGHLDVVLLWPFIRLRRIPLLFNPLVSLYDTFITDRRTVRPESLTARVVHAIDRLSFTIPDRVIWDTRTHATYISRMFNVDPGRFAIVPVGAEAAFFGPARVARQTPPQVLFFGKYIPLHGIDTIVEAARILSSEDISFLFVGTGQEYARIRETVVRHGLMNIRFVDWLDTDALKDEIDRSSVVLGIFSKGGKGGRVIPNKVYQSAAAGAVTITADTEAIREMFPCDGDMLLVPPASPGALADKIRWAVRNGGEALRVAVRSRDIVARKGDEKAVGEAVMSVVMEIAG